MPAAGSLVDRKEDTGFSPMRTRRGVPDAAAAVDKAVEDQVRQITKGPNDEQTWEGLPYKSKPRIRKEGDPAPVQQGTPHCEVFDTSEPADLKKYNELLLKIAAHSSYALISTDKTFSQQSNGYILMVHWTAYYFVEAEDINK